MPIRTPAAERTVAAIAESGQTVFTAPALAELGCTRTEIRAQLARHDWRRAGRAIVVHPRSLTRAEGWRVALLNCGPRAALTSFTALEAHGLTGWTRDEIHVLTARGARVTPVDELSIVRHVVADWRPADITPGRRHHIAPAAIVATRSLADPDSAGALLAAVVHQRLAAPTQLRAVLAAHPTLPNRRRLIKIVDGLAAAPGPA